MRNAALILGIIGGLLAMIVGFFSYGYTVLTETHQEVSQFFGQVHDVQMIRLASFLGPLLAIAGGAMARVRALWGGVLMLVAAGLLYMAFGFGVFTMFPIGFCLVGGLLAVAAGKPDEEKSHF